MGGRAGRDDRAAFRPACVIDPGYCRWRRRALEAGVRVLLYQARVPPREIALVRRLDLIL